MDDKTAISRSISREKPGERRATRRAIEFAFAMRDGATYRTHIVQAAWRGTGPIEMGALVDKLEEAFAQARAETDSWKGPRRFIGVTPHFDIGAESSWWFVTVATSSKALAIHEVMAPSATGADAAALWRSVSLEMDPDADPVAFMEALRERKVMGRVQDKCDRAGLASAQRDLEPFLRDILGHRSGGSENEHAGRRR